MRILIICLWLLCGVAVVYGAQGYPIVGTGQARCYDAAREIAAPRPGQPFYGQDAQHPGVAPAYTDNGNGTITDRVTGLIWVKARGEKVTWEQAMAGATACRAGGHADWRAPSIKELYSLILFTGSVGRGVRSVPFMHDTYFDFKYGDPAKGERDIDCQDWSATAYLGTTMGGDATVFGVNFADGRIKGYPKTRRGPHGAASNRLYIRYVRGNPAYGKNDFRDHGDGTVTDRATGLMWAKADSGAGMDWGAALAWVQAKNAEKYLGHADWRLPNAKELQSLVDYARIPAIAPVFTCTKLPDGEYPWYWSSTTHLDGPPEQPASAAVYLAVGRALGWTRMPPTADPRLLDVHGAGAQRSDPKRGNPADFPYGRGPQGDVIRINNLVRPVRAAM